ncbi:MAG: hypothetical protein KDD35_01250, partial [Bdellovibrionales bacterium]|nr:hypothetical protein [Bdellovibrionales bacterium]
QLKSLIPVVIHARQFKALKEDGSLHVDLPTVVVEVGFPSVLTAFPSISFGLNIKMEDPSLKVILPQGGNSEIKTVPEASPSSPLMKWLRPDFKVHLVVSRGRVDIQMGDEGSSPLDKKTQISFKGINLIFQQDSIFNNHRPMILNLDTMVSYLSPLSSLELPISIDTRNVTTTSNSVEAKTINLNIGGLLATAAGTTQFQPLQHNWIVLFEVPEIEKIKIPPQFLPPGNWFGEISGKIHFAQKDSSPPYIATQGFIRGLRGDTEMHGASLQMRGGVAADARWNVIYSNSLNIKELSAIIDLSGAQLRYLDWFQKKDTDRLRIEIEAKTEGKAFRISKGNLEFTRMLARVNGLIETQNGKNSFLSVAIPKLNLEGFESFFPFLGNHPLRGQLELKAEIRGDFTQPEKLRVKVAPFKLEGINTALKYFNAKQRIEVQGPLAMNSDIELVAEGAQLKSAKASLSVDLGRMSFSYGDMVRKRSGDPLSLRLQANQMNDRIVLHRLNFIHPAGSLWGTGDFQRPQKPKFNFKIDIEKLNLGKLSQFIPLLSKYDLSGGSVKGEVKSSGVYDFALGYTQSPFSVVAQLSTNFPQFTLDDSPSSGEKAKKEKKEAFQKLPRLPEWPVVVGSQLSLNAQVGRLNLGNESFKNSSAQLKYVKGNLTGGLSVEQLFGGSLKIDNINIGLREIHPFLKLRAQVTQLDLTRMGDWLFPTKPGRIKGQVSLKSRLGVPWPETEAWYRSISSQGQVSVQNFFLSSLDIDEKINQALGKLLKGQEKKEINSKGVSASLKSQFSSQEGQIRLAHFLFSTPEKNQITAQGSLDFNLVGELIGELSLANTSLSGSIYAANADAQGRLVIPLEIKGDLTHPNINIAKASIEKMLAKTIEYEKNKALKEVENKAQQEIKKSIESGKKKIEEGINKKIKDLFQRK